MTNEIKEIDNSDLMELLETTSKKEYYRLTIDHELVVRLYNWITNLQEENERLKNLYTNEKSHKIDCNYFRVLYSKADKNIIIEDLVYKCEQCRILYDSAEKKLIENMNLQQRIDKAIEYCNNNIEFTPRLLDIIDILRGDE